MANSVRSTCREAYLFRLVLITTNSLVAHDERQTFLFERLVPQTACYLPTQRRFVCDIFAKLKSTELTSIKRGPTKPEETQDTPHPRLGGGKSSVLLKILVALSPLFAQTHRKHGQARGRSYSTSVTCRMYAMVYRIPISCGARLFRAGGLSRRSCGFWVA